MIKSAIFDLDGTIADTLESIAYSCNEALAVCGFGPLETEVYKYYAGDGADTLIRRALAACGDRLGNSYKKAYEAYLSIFRKYCTYHVKAFEGLTKTLEVLKEQGVKLAVVTNKPEKRALTVVESLYGKGFFDVIIGAREGFPKKPDPTGAILAAKQTQAEITQCIYVGDTNVDMITGNAAGMFTIGVLWGFREKKELEENGADVIIEKPEELLRYIQ